MIHYVTVSKFPIRSFLESSGKPLAEGIGIVPYPKLQGLRALPPGTWIFADVERLAPRERRAAGRICERLLARADCRVLNHPERSLARFELLRELRARGRNGFAIHPAWRVPRGARFPLFLRLVNRHEGAWSPLLPDRAALHRARARAIFDLHLRRRVRPRDLAAVEYLDTADAEGVHRKYSAFAVGKAIVPRHLFFAPTWEVKRATLRDEAHLAEERAYVKANPHEAELRALFELAKIDFGRIDYTVRDGALHVFEINTNPMMTLPEDAQGPRAPILHLFVERFLPALEAIDSARGTG